MAVNERRKANVAYLAFRREIKDQFTHYLPVLRIIQDGSERWDSRFSFSKLGC
jgi:hypothetical protein